MTESKIVQTTGNRHHEVTDVVLPVAQFVLHYPAALHARHGVLDPHFLAGDAVVLGFLVVRQRATAWFLGWLLDVNPGNGKALKAHVLVQHAAGW